LFESAPGAIPAATAISTQSISLIVSEDGYQYWRDKPGNVYHEAASRDRTLYEAA
jgi:hypothetical protein